LLDLGTELTVGFLKRAEELLAGGGLGQSVFVDRETQGAGTTKVKLSVIRPTDTYDDGEPKLKMEKAGPRPAKNKPWGGAPPPQCPPAAVHHLHHSTRWIAAATRLLG
jgi:hypothetical protein